MAIKSIRFRAEVLDSPLTVPELGGGLLPFAALWPGRRRDYDGEGV
ncbi:hypothetical protein [Serratia rhizosphaerae]|nr:hypothetical protein [Serratia rhizosphaerae]